jgi:glycogen debranching enzyme
VTLPYLHDLVVTLAAPWVALSNADGQIGGGVQGVFERDRRVLSGLALRVDGREPVPVATAETSAYGAEFTAVLDWLGSQDRHDPTVTLRRRRSVDSHGLTEEIMISNRAGETVSCEVELSLAADLAGTFAVRSGAAGDLPEVAISRAGGRLTWSDVTAVLEPAPDEATGTWRCEVPHGGEWTLRLRLTAAEPEGTGFRIQPPRDRDDLSRRVLVDCDDSRVARWLRRSLSDVAGLMLADPESADDRYLGAGPPWYLTLFGRDSLISSAMLLAVDPELAAGTLRALARRQGTAVDPDTAEQPGKIPHELRAAAADHGGGLVLPAAYYGTHDATGLWLTTLHRAWRWGMPAGEVAALIPSVRRALGWLRDYADPDGDGFGEYVDASGHGLANQGWKDSPDAVQWPDGTLATAPIALSEVQGYAYAAALAGADLLDTFGQDGEPWRDWGAALKARFRKVFWIDDEHGGYPAIALDADKRPVAGLASNMGHLPATGILDPADADIVAARLASPELDSGYGLRTLSTRAHGFNPLGYHTGSVWPHDTALAIEGLAMTGHPRVATAYLRGLLNAAEAFGYRLPELYGGLGAAAEPVPTPYPLACRPQAWAAAAPVSILTALLGIQPDVPGGTLRIAPVRPFPWRRFEIRGLRVGGGTLSLRIDGDTVEPIDVPEGLQTTTAATR